MEEIWKDIPGYEGLYQVSNLCNVKSFDRIHCSGMGRTYFKPGRILRPAKGSHGYLGVVLCKDKNKVSNCIHSLVAKAFISNPLSLRYINHKDGNKLNNSIENLEWVTARQNTQHAYDTDLKKPYRKITTDHVIQIRALSKHLGMKQFQLVAMYSANQSAISEIINYKLRLNG